MLDQADKDKEQVVITKKEVVKPTGEKVNRTRVIHTAKIDEEFAGVTGVEEDAYYEVLSPKINEQMQREVPIFVEDRGYIIPSQVSRNTQQTEVSKCQQGSDHFSAISSINL